MPPNSLSEPSPCPTGTPSPFDPDQGEAYLRWRDSKLTGYPRDPSTLLVEVGDPHRLRTAERKALLAACRKTNMAIYVWDAEPIQHPKPAVRRMGEQLGLRRLDHNLCADPDGIASLRVIAEGRPQEYIPYSNRPIRWHTDGYYNRPEEQIRAFILHCVSDAASGGANRMLDPEMLYVTMRDEDPDYIRALMAPKAMTIPPNWEGEKLLRPAQSGPVFSVSPADGSPNMRYTARTHSIEWAPDELTREAVGFLERLLNNDLPYVYEYRLAPGHGVLCNNVLHSREAFKDDPAARKTRLFLRARYYDRIADTAPP